MTMEQWWRGAVLYEIYPRSFADSNGDGIGDLRGILPRLEYLANLGIDAIWIAPFFTSPMKDYGYDVSDYKSVDPMFGDLRDFDAVVEKAHKLGLKVTIDQVLSHTSIQHPWFLESRACRTGAKHDWYVWADAKGDGTPPNNWLSIFGGVAWEWGPERGQYYFHNFLASQPDLNLHHSEVQDAVLDVSRFWLERGVDGFRLDTSDFYFCDRQLRDNPAKPKSLVEAQLQRTRAADGVPNYNPYGFQYHRYDKTQPEAVEFYKRYRALLDKYGAASVAEIASDDSFAVVGDYTTGNDKLHMAYTFDLLTTPLDASRLRRLFREAELKAPGGWPCWALSNHDVERAVSRWPKSGNERQKARLLMALLMSQRGSVCIYQGEELGLTEGQIAFEDLRDPYGKQFWPRYKGRDGCRTPMPWSSTGKGGGFSAGSPWLPMQGAHLANAVDVQQRDPQSVLNHYKHFLKWRKSQPALLFGSVEYDDTDDPILSLVRRYGTQEIVAVFNVSDREVVQPLRSHGPFDELIASRHAGELDGDRLRLPAYGYFFAKKREKRIV